MSLQKHRMRVCYVMNLGLRILIWQGVHARGTWVCGVSVGVSVGVALRVLGIQPWWLDSLDHQFLIQ